MLRQTDDLRITQVRPLIPPAILLEEIPITERASNVVVRHAAGDRQRARGPRPAARRRRRPLLDSRHEGGARVRRSGCEPLAERYADQLIVVMRSYFEKPRTSVGWKGLINDPDLDESFHINKGLRLARQLLLDVNDLGLPTASEFLDTQIPQHIADLTSWVAIGARTTESQVHRELASGLSMPVGFKNGTDGNTQTAVDAVLAARSPHWFPSVTKQGVSAIFQTTGNDTCHVILRGGTRTGPNYDAGARRARSARGCAAKGLRETVMIDCSHGNSQKDHRRQAEVAASICEQVASGRWQIFGAMLESHLVEGRQDYVPGPAGGLRPEHHRRVPLARADRAAARAAGGGAAEARPSLTLEPDPFGLQPHPHQVHVGGDVERAAVVAEGAVGGGLAGADGAEVLALRRDDQHAARPGGEQVALGVDLQAVGQPVAGLDRSAVTSSRTRLLAIVPSGLTSNTRQIAAVASDCAT